MPIYAISLDHLSHVMKFNVQKNGRIKTEKKKVFGLRIPPVGN
jgi:hypothetical protein